MMLRSFFSLLQAAYREWADDRAERLGAALAYYALFSIAPLLLIIIAIAGWVFGEAAARGQIVHALADRIGPATASAVEQLLVRVHTAGAGGIATILGVLFLALGATGLFGQLKDALNTIWNVQLKPSSTLLGGIRRVIRDRVLAALLVIGASSILLVALTLNTGLTALNSWLQTITPSAAVISQGGNLLAGLGLTTLLFAVIFKVLPDVRIAWRVVWVGAWFTSVLFNIGAFLIGLYLGLGRATAIFGATGAFVAVLIWVYYSAQIVFFGAEFTQVYATAIGLPIVPAAEAMSMRAPKSAAVDSA